MLSWAWGISWKQTKDNNVLAECCKPIKTNNKLKKKRWNKIKKEKRRRRRRRRRRSYLSNCLLNWLLILKTNINLIE
jgi:hypothetical protein